MAAARWRLRYNTVYLYTDDLVGILPERRLNNGQRLADGGRLILPMTSDQGFGAKSLEGVAKAGAVFRIERRARDYLAYWISPVAIYPCAGP